MSLSGLFTATFAGERCEKSRIVFFFFFLSPVKLGERRRKAKALQRLTIPAGHRLLCECACVRVCPRVHGVKGSVRVFKSILPGRPSFTLLTPPNHRRCPLPSPAPHPIPGPIFKGLHGSYGSYAPPPLRKPHARPHARSTGVPESPLEGSRVSFRAVLLRTRRCSNSISLIMSLSKYLFF